MMSRATPQNINAPLLISFNRQTGTPSEFFFHENPANELAQLPATFVNVGRERVSGAWVNAERFKELVCGARKFDTKQALVGDAKASECHEFGNAVNDLE
jgi:hypothetical protein